MYWTFHIFHFFRTTACQVTKLTTNVLLGVLKKSCIFFEVIRNPRWQPWPLIGRYIFNFFTRITALQVTSSGPQEVFLLFRVIWYPTWLLQSVIGWDIFFPTLHGSRLPACLKCSSRGTWRSVHTFWSSLKSKMVVLDSFWLSWTFLARLSSH